MTENTGTTESPEPEEPQEAVRSLRRTWWSRPLTARSGTVRGHLTVFGTAALTLLGGVSVELLGNSLSDSLENSVLGPVVSVATFLMIGGAVLVVLVYSYTLWRGRRRTSLETPELPPDGSWLVWEPPHAQLYGREWEIDAALERARTGQMVAVAGPRDIGTSAVAHEVARRLDVGVDPATGRPARYRLDVRSRSSRGPAPVREVASRLFAGFGLDEPTRDDPASLEEAAYRLRSHLEDRRCVLLLDEVTSPEQVKWLVGPLSGARGITLVVAGEAKVAEAFGEEHVVWVQPLAVDAGLQLLHRELGERRTRFDETMLRQLVEACLGRPRAVMVAAHELVRRQIVVESKQDETVWNGQGRQADPGRRRQGRQDGPAELVQQLRSADHLGEQVLYRVWQATVERIKSNPEQEGGLSAAAWELLKALAGLAVTGLPEQAVLAIQRSRSRAALDELVANHLVREVAPHQFRMPQEVRTAVTHGLGEQEITRASNRATVRLMAYYADRASASAVALVVPATSQQAARWFRAEEPLLRVLVTEHYQSDLLQQVFSDLCQVVDALEVWYVRAQLPDLLHAVARRQLELAGVLGEHTVEALARIRLAVADRMRGELVSAERHLSALDRRCTGALEARRQNAWAVLRLAQFHEQVRNNGDQGAELLREAEIALSRCLRRLPVADRVGEIGVWVNLGLARLYQGELLSAMEHLTRAKSLADRLRYGPGQAHATEVLGAVDWACEARTTAMRRWQEALRHYRTLGADEGTGRCLQHLGRAVRAVPRLVDELRGDLAPRRQETADDVATRLLRQGAELRQGATGWDEPVLSAVPRPRPSEAGDGRGRPEPGSVGRAEPGEAPPV